MKIEIEDREVFRIIKANNNMSFVWYDIANSYTVTSNLKETEILKFIKNTKILKNF